MKKIFNIFASISLISTGASAVVACGSNPSTSSNDQKLVNDVINHLDNKTFNVDENPNGIKNFGNYYEKEVLDQARLKKQEKSLVNIPSKDNQIKLDTRTKIIDVHIQSHKIYQDINIPVKLNYDAQSIANAIKGKTITVFQTGGYKTSESANKYTKEIKQQINNLLTPEEQKSAYQISGWENFTIYWPQIDKDPNQPIPMNIQIGKDKASASIKLEFKYYKQKEVLDDPRKASWSNPLSIEETTVAEWDQGLAREDLTQDWGDVGGLTTDLENDVVYKCLQILDPKKGIGIGTKALCELYFKDGAFGYTQETPRYFWVEGN